MSDEFSDELGPLQVRIDRWVQRSTFARTAVVTDISDGSEMAMKFRYSIPVRPMAIIKVSGTWQCHHEYGQVLTVHVWQYLPPKAEQSIEDNLQSLNKLHNG